MAVTVDDVVAATRRHLYGMQRGERNRLAADMSAVATTLTTTFDLKGLAPGSFFAIDDEILYAYDTGSKAVTDVGRAELGSTAAAHTSGAIIDVNPRFPRFAILKALIDEIRSLPPMLYATTSVVITASDPNVRGFDLDGVPDTFLGILSVNAEPRVSAVGQVDSSMTWPATGFRVLRGLPTGDFASGNALFLDRNLNITASTRRISVTYAKPFTTSTFTGATDLVATVGMTESMTDIPALGAAWRLMIGRDIPRSDTQAQGQSRDDAAVPPLFMTQKAADLKRTRDTRVTEEMRSLVRKYGYHGF